MFQIGDVIQYSTSYATSWALICGKNYRVLDTDTHRCGVLLIDDNGNHNWYDESYFKLVPAGGFSIGDDASPLPNRPAPVHFSQNSIYRVMDVDKTAGEIQLSNDTGITGWYDHRSFEHYQYPQKQMSSCSDDSYGNLKKSLDDEYGIKCTCPMRELLMYGCRCGGFDAEQRRKKS